MAQSDAVQAWKNKVRRHHTQSLSVQEKNPPDADFWRTRASGFRADPRREPDAALRRVLDIAGPDTTVLDVGAGGGRLALPLALRCRHVTAVEPSPSMVEQLCEGAAEAGISNLSVVQANWEDAEVEPADLVICSHVVYGVVEIDQFVRKLDAHARGEVAVFAFMESPPSRFASFWSAVYGEERLNMPALPELLQVLWQLDIYPNVEMLPADARSAFESREDAVRQVASFLWVVPGSEEEERLLAAANELLEEDDDGFRIKGAKFRPNGLVTWKPDRERLG
jgi:2-polyprenyl-3-methyl-5-hydroxy-6-metoxy-1,4-benzoquinol methylase